MQSNGCKTRCGIRQRTAVTCGIAALLSFLLFILCFSRAYGSADRIVQTGIEAAEIRQLVKQLPLLCVLLLHVCLGICLTGKICIAIDSVCKQQVKLSTAIFQMVTAAAIICGGLVLILHFLDIPNRFLPPKSILDGLYYIGLPAYWNTQSWGTLLQKEMAVITIYGVLAVASALVSVFLPFWLKRSIRK